MNPRFVTTIEWDDRREVIASMSLSQATLIPSIGGMSMNIAGMSNIHFLFDKNGVTADETNQITDWATSAMNTGEDQQTAEQDTVSARPEKVTTSGGINNRQAAQFDGLQDYISVASFAVMRGQLVVMNVDDGAGDVALNVDDGGTSDVAFKVRQPINEGALIVAGETGSTAFSGDQVIFSCADPNANNQWIELGIDSAGKVYFEVNEGGTVHRVTGDTVLANDAAFVARVESDDTAWSMWVNGTAQTLTVSVSNSGKWGGDLSPLDNTTLGARVDSDNTSGVDFFEGKIAEVCGLLTTTNADTVDMDYRTRYGI